MTSPKEDQQPMTTREELVACRKQRMDQIDYSVDLQRIIEDLCHGRPIREPQTGARHHYEMAVAYRLASRQEVSVEELALELMNARRRMTGLEELSAERVKKIGLWPLKEETMCAARALLAEYSITKRTTEG